MTSSRSRSSVAAALPTLSVFDITNEVSRDVAQARRCTGARVRHRRRSPTSLVRVTRARVGLLLRLRGAARAARPARRAPTRERMLLALLGPRTEQIPFADGRLCLGQWQRVLLFGFNGDPRADYTLTLVG